MEKAVEGGATEVIPVETTRSATVATRIRDEHRERLSRRALESIKQCGAPWVPVVRDVLSLGEVLTRGFPGQRWLADSAGEAPPVTLPVAEEVTVLVGPEGGWTDEERGAILGAGYRAVTFGPHVMRFETAALAGAVLAQAARSRGAPANP